MPSHQAWAFGFIGGEMVANNTTDNITEPYEGLGSWNEEGEWTASILRMDVPVGKQSAIDWVLVTLKEVAGFTQERRKVNVTQVSASTTRFEMGLYRTTQTKRDKLPGGYTFDYRPLEWETELSFDVYDKGKKHVAISCLCREPLLWANEFRLILTTLFRWWPDARWISKPIALFAQPVEPTEGDMDDEFGGYQKTRPTKEYRIRAVATWLFKVKPKGETTKFDFGIHVAGSYHRFRTWVTNHRAEAEEYDRNKRARN